MDLDAARRQRRARLAWLPALAAVWAAATLMGLGIGAVDVPPSRILELLGEALRAVSGGGATLAALLDADPVARIVLQIRLPRLLLAGLVGACLGAAGAAFQGMFRNPMADPYVIGVSGGASLGAVLALYLSLRVGVLPLAAVPASAFVFALGTVALVFALARQGGRISVLALLLSGVAVASCCAALVTLLVYLSGEQVRPLVFWLMGSLATATWRDVAALLPYAVLGVAVLWQHARALNALLLGEEPAHHLGVDPERAKRLVLLAGSLLAAAAVSVSGAIGFVGLIVPHVVRLLAGPDHRVLVPAAALCGATLLVICDALARSLAPPLEVPVGVVTALAGGPFFLIVLRRRLQAMRGL